MNTTLKIILKSILITLIVYLIVTIPAHFALGTKEFLRCSFIDSCTDNAMWIRIVVFPLLYLVVLGCTYLAHQEITFEDVKELAERHDITINHIIDDRYTISDRYMNWSIEINLYTKEKYNQLYDIIETLSKYKSIKDESL